VGGKYNLERQPMTDLEILKRRKEWKTIVSAYARRICAVTRGFQTTTRDLSVFPFLPRHYHMTRVLLSPFITILSGHLWSLQ